MKNKISGTYETYAVVLGYLLRDDGVMRRTTFNKLINELGYDSLNKEVFKSIVETVKQNEKYSNLYVKACNGYVTLDDLKGYNDEGVTEQGVNSIVTPNQVDKEITRILTRNYRKSQRAAVAQEYQSSKIAEAFRDYLLAGNEIIQSDNEPGYVDGNNIMIVSLSDWHIGATVDDINGNSFNVEIARQRLETFVDTVLEKIRQNRVSKVFIIHQGDFAENVQMRNINQAFDAELDTAEQIAIATRMLVDIIKIISEEVEETVVGVIGGNHDRYTPNKKDAIYNDNFAYNIADTLIMLKEYGVFNDNVAVIDNRKDIYSVEFQVFDKTVRAIHGDNVPNTDKPKIPLMIKNHLIDYVYYGHYHSTKVIQENGSTTSIMVGSLQGNNTYSKQLNLPDSKASQLITIFEPDFTDSPTYIPVYLD